MEEDANVLKKLRFDRGSEFNFSFLLADVFDFGGLGVNYWVQTIVSL